MSSTNTRPESYPLAEIIREYSSLCGYCKTKRTGGAGPQVVRKSRKRSFGFYARDITARLYDKLINRNWRRSGHLIYWPINSTICCPQYAIRLRASEFDPRRSKHHRKVMNRLQRFLKTGSVTVKEDTMSSQPSLSVSSLADTQSVGHADVIRAVEEEIKKAIRSLFGNEDIAALSMEDHGFNVDRVVKVTAPKKRVHTQVDLCCNVVLVMMGLYHKHKIRQGHSLKQITELLVQQMHVDQLCEVKKVNAADNGFINIELSSDKKQQQQHDQQRQDKDQALQNKKKRKIETQNRKDVHTGPKHRLTLELEPAGVKDDEFKLFKKYQIAIHHDEPSSVNRHRYDNFLCSSSLELQEKDVGNDDHRQYPLKGYGTYHVRYMLDSTKLLAVSVVDVLPTGWSSVYFFYDPDYSDLSLGVVSAIKEIELVRQESLRIPEFQYMYLGYYIHSCQKMQYKAQYEPSELLCPVTLTWVPFSDVKPKLDEHKYCKFAPDNVPADPDLQQLHCAGSQDTRLDIIT